MFILSRTTRDCFQDALVRTLRTEQIIDRIVLGGAKLNVRARTWREYWEPFYRFAGVDSRLIHRLNRLKTAWRAMLRPRRSRRAISRYCWRYFGLLHHAIQIGMERGEPKAVLPVIRQIVGFECFLVEVPEKAARAGGLVCHRNPVYLLGRLPESVCHPTPRHVPLILPMGTQAPFYHYRQHTLADRKTKILLFPEVDLEFRQRSFLAIDRFARMTTNRPDPYANSRAEVLSTRVLVPLLRAMLAGSDHGSRGQSWRMLDIGAGTGHLAGKACLELCRQVPSFRETGVDLCCIDSSEPSNGRTYGLSGNAREVSSVDWITADYRQLLDEDSWLQHRPRFQIAMLCRLLDNMSLFSLEPISVLGPAFTQPERSCLPQDCLSPRQTTGTSNNLRVLTTKQATLAGRVMPQLSLCEFFAAMKAAWQCDPGYLHRDEWALPGRRFNPASLSTRAGKSVIGQLMKVADAVVIEDLDLIPEDLERHMRQFGVANAAVIQFTHDGFTTEAFHYAIVSPDIASRLKGKRLW